MKNSLAMISFLITLTACSGNKLKVDTVPKEELSTDFVAEGIKVESRNCGLTGKMFGLPCEITKIESTSTAPSNGGTTVNRKNAMDVACAQAKANVRHWKEESVSSNRFVERVAESTEISESKEIQSSVRDEGSKENSNRENQNNTKIRITNTIRQTASGSMKGWAIIKQEIVGPQEVSCTMAWSLKNTMLMNQSPGL